MSVFIDFWILLYRFPREKYRAYSLIVLFCMYCILYKLIWLTLLLRFLYASHLKIREGCGKNCLNVWTMSRLNVWSEDKKLWTTFETSDIYRFLTGEEDTYPQFQYNWTTVPKLQPLGPTHTLINHLNFFFAKQIKKTNCYLYSFFYFSI